MNITTDRRKAMSEAVLVAVITGGLALVGTVVSVAMGNRLTAYKIEEMRDDLTDLSARVNKHNNLVERMAIVEQSAKSAHHRLDEIKQGY
ncbi:MAG: hypothetical protein RR893_09325 [Clostridia bacterium]